MKEMTTMATRLAMFLRMSALTGLLGLGAVSCGSSEEASGGIPAAPSELMAGDLPGAVHITWKDNATDEHHFVLQRKPATGGDYAALSPNPNPNASQFHDTVAPGTYTYRIAAANAKGEMSAWSNEATGKSM
jgi:hypothetical protein